VVVALDWEGIKFGAKWSGISVEDPGNNSVKRYLNRESYLEVALDPWIRLFI